jgi:hypothetical protein
MQLLFYYSSRKPRVNGNYFWDEALRSAQTEVQGSYTNLSSGWTLTKRHNSHIEGFLEIAI